MTKQDNLFELLSELKDHRRSEGRMHELRFVVLLVIMSSMSGFSGVRATGDFIKKNKKDLIKIFKPKNNRLPSRQTVGRVMQNIDFNELIKIFHKWSANYIEIKDGEWISIDGKAIRGTVSKPNNSKQEFINLVSIFVSKQKHILHVGKINNKKQSEIPKVRELINSLSVKNAVLTLDALHCQKETTRLIIESKNNYCIGVKKNQKKLYEQIKKT